MFLVRFEGDDRIIKLYECMEQQFGFDKISTSLDINEVTHFYQDNGSLSSDLVTEFSFFSAFPAISKSTFYLYARQ